MISGDPDIKRGIVKRMHAGRNQPKGPYRRVTKDPVGNDLSPELVEGSKDAIPNSNSQRPNARAGSNCQKISLHVRTRVGRESSAAFRRQLSYWTVKGPAG